MGLQLIRNDKGYSRQEALLAPWVEHQGECADSGLFGAGSLINGMMRPLGRRECLHRQGVDFFTHTLTQRTIDDLVALHA